MLQNGLSEIKRFIEKGWPPLNAAPTKRELFNALTRAQADVTASGDLGTTRPFKENCIHNLSTTLVAADSALAESTRSPDWPSWSVEVEAR